MHCHYATCKHKTYSGAGFFSENGILGAIEALEDIFVCRLWNTYASVGNCYYHTLAFTSRRHSNLSMLGRIFYGIRKQMLKQLSCKKAIHQHIAVSRQIIHRLQVDMLFTCEQLEFLYLTAHKVFHGNRSHLQLLSSDVGLLEVEQLTDKTE